MDDDEHELKLQQKLEDIDVECEREELEDKELLLQLRIFDEVFSDEDEQHDVEEELFIDNM